MKNKKVFYVYIMSNNSKVLYTGITNDLNRRVYEHKIKQNKNSFTSKYGLNKLVFFEQWESPQQAIVREKQLKGWLRIKKIKLIKKENPNWIDLSDEWY